MSPKTTIPLRILIAASLLTEQPLGAETQTPPQAREPYPIVVTPGTPSIWSMEQAHYLLSRLRATNDGLQTKMPGSADLDANAVNGIRLQALQTTLNASAAYNAVTGLQNQIALGQFAHQTTQRDVLMGQAQSSQIKLYQDQLILANLSGQQIQLQQLQSANAAQSPPVNDPILAQNLASISGKITALTAQNTATSGLISSLTTQAGSLPPQPTLQSVTPSATLPAPPQILAQTVQSLLTKTANNFDGPKLQASIALDNFLQMQYEIVAKQLTTLRDQTGAHRRILFLEMPTSIQASDRRRLFLGGEDKLAQSWWRVTKIYRRYKTEDSPCWSGEFDNDELRHRNKPSSAPAKTVQDSLAPSAQKVKAAADLLEKLKTAGPRLAAPQAVQPQARNSQEAPNPASKDKSAESLTRREQFDMYREQFLAAAAELDHNDRAPDAFTVGVPAIEANCSEARKHSKNAREQLEDQLNIYQAEIYNLIGGPDGMLKAYVEDIDTADNLQYGQNSGKVRTVELIPRQTALNVNTAHDLVRNSALSFAWNALFGFGLKVDYQRQKENYDQFIQQESFSSSFGKGKTTFGWTFGPLPGTRVLNSGDRNTYAVLEVPEDTSYLELEGEGCAFHRKKFPLQEFPSENALEDYHCSKKLVTEVRVPDITNSGGFWLSGVDYKAVDAGNRTSVILRGGYFPPQTTILVNGLRIPQILGVGKPALNMDAGTADPPPDAAAISGTFEFVNQEQLTLNLSIPANYNGPSFPTITVVAPARAMIINYLRLRINGSSSRLDEEILVKRKPMAISNVQYLRTRFGRFTAHINGQSLSNLAEVRLNGESCDFPDILSESVAQVQCDLDDQSQWEFVGLSADSDPKKRSLSTWIMPNPRLILLTGTDLMDGTQYGADLHPSLITVQIHGSGFTPRTMLVVPAADRARFTLTYVNQNTLICAIQKPQASETINVSDQSRDGTSAILVARPPDKAKDDPPAATTTITKQVVKKVVKN